MEVARFDVNTEQWSVWPRGKEGGTETQEGTQTSLSMLSLQMQVACQALLWQKYCAEEYQTVHVRTEEGN